MSDALTFEALAGPLESSELSGPAFAPALVAGASRLADFVSRRSSMSSPRPEQNGVGDMDKSFRSAPNTLHRLRMWLRERYPQNTAKLVARDIEADPRTVENWLASDPQPPIWRHWEAMMQAYGPVFVMAVFAPPTERRREILAELDDLERRHRELHQTIRRLREAV